MVEEDKVFSGKTKHSGFFDFKDTYNFCYEWLTEEGYFVQEKKYVEKVKPGGKEIEVEWEADRKISDYFKFRIKVRFLILGMKEVEVEQDGKKIKMNKGEMNIFVTAILLKDYENRWENSAIMKFLRGIYDRFIIRERIDKYEEKIFSEADEFIAQIRSFLALEGQH